MTLPIKTFLGLSAEDFFGLINDESAKLTYSQLGEDVILFHLLMNNVRKLGNGFYADFGAYHPRRFSNTRILSLLGWRGINVDPSEDAIALFQAERPGDINVCCGAAGVEGTLTYHRFEDGAASTFSKAVADEWRTANGWRLVETRQVTVRPINDILAEHVPPGVAIDYMNIDVEGMDRELVESLDFARFSPSVLAVEMHDADKLNLSADPTVAHLLAQDYGLEAVCGVTFVFMQRRFRA